MILIDNYDSFTYNIVQYLQELGVTPRVFKNDEVTIEELKNMPKLTPNEFKVLILLDENRTLPDIEKI